MDYFRELFFCIVIFFIGYLIFKYDVTKRLIRTRVLEKDFKGCYILRYPNRVEFHNKGQTYLIDFDDFFEQNPKLKGKIKIIDNKNICISSTNIFISISTISCNSKGNKTIIL